MRPLRAGLCALTLLLGGAGSALAAPAPVTSSGKFGLRFFWVGRTGPPVFTGAITSTRYGLGVVAAQMARSSNRLSGTFKIYFDSGMLSGTATNKLRRNRDGTYRITDGTATLTRGTGAFRNFRGDGTYSGGTTKDGALVATYRLTVRRKP